MNEDKLVTWVMGFCVGIMFTIGADRLMDQQPQPEPDVETIRAEAIIDIYNRGKAEALQVSGTGLNLELEQACLTLWATKQGESK